MSSVLPLLALRAFVETGRLGSLKAAAENLGVTPGAVSQQIRQLEDRLGIQLFIRAQHGMHLTEAAIRVYPGLLQAFNKIEESVLLLKESSSGKRLTISAAPSFASSWLVPRISRFHALHPGIEVNVEATSKLTDFKTGGVDVALRHGLGNYPGLTSILLMSPELLPVISPALLMKGPTLTTPADCLKYPLIQEEDRADWKLWFQAHGVNVGDEAERGASYNNDLLLLRAASAGHGIALVQEIHVREDLESGRLVVAVNCPWPSRFAYYAVCRPDVLSRPEVSAFINWVKEEADAK